MKNFEHVNAASFSQASQELREAKNGQPIAGGTDLLGTLKKNILPEFPGLVVNLKTIPNASYILDQGDKVAVGALTTLAEVESSGAFSGELQAVAQAAHSVATPIIRNTAHPGRQPVPGRALLVLPLSRFRGRPAPVRPQGRRPVLRHPGPQPVSLHYGRHEDQPPELLLRRVPRRTDIPGYMQKIREGDWDAAAEIILRVNPMPMLTARVCPHTCQTVCNQCEHGDSVSIHSVERALGDYILAHADKFYQAPGKSTGKKVSIVGGGPAGLTAAYYLRKMGHEVTIYEKMEEAGGVMMYGIPEYRLPKHYVRDLVKALVGMGIVIRNNTEVGKDVTVEELKAQSDTVFLDTGAWKQPILGIDGESLTQFGLNFLVEVKKFMTKQIGKEVLVCGGGNVAMDVALTAVRLGAQKVKLVCLEQRDEMPASAEEIARAEEEGVEIYNGWGLKRVLSAEDGSITGLESMNCVSVRTSRGTSTPPTGTRPRSSPPTASSWPPARRWTPTSWATSTRKSSRAPAASSRWASTGTPGPPASTPAATRPTAPPWPSRPSGTAASRPSI